MLSFLLFGSAQVAEAGVLPQVVIDMEAWNWGRRLDQWGDDEVHEDTTCRICAAEVKGGKQYISCKKGLVNRTGGDHIVMRKDFDKDADAIILQTDCSDALWIDRLIACEKDDSWIWPWETKHACLGAPEKIWGANNQHGWCLSTDRHDYKSWNSDGHAQHVPANQCFRALKFARNGSVYGYQHNIVGRRLDDDAEMDFDMEDGDFVQLTGNAVHKTVVIDEYISTPVGSDRR